MQGAGAFANREDPRASSGPDGRHLLLLSSRGLPQAGFPKGSGAETGFHPRILHAGTRKRTCPISLLYF